MSVCSDFVSVGPDGPVDGSVAPVDLRSHPGGHGVRVDRAFETKGPDERPPLDGELQAPFGGVQVRSASRSRSVWVGLGGVTRFVPSGNDSHQSGLVRSLSTTDARADHRGQV